MTQVDAEVCLQANCPFVCKKSGNAGGVDINRGVCLTVFVTRRPKNLVCISKVPIRVANGKGR